MKKKKFLFITLILLVIIGVSVKCFYDYKIKNNNNDEKLTQIHFEKNDQIVKQSFKILGNVKRQKVTYNNENATRYPTFGTSLQNITDEEKDMLLNEANYLKSSETTYDEMDSLGNLYLKGEKLDRKLYAHTTSANNYYGSVSEDEIAVIKQISINPRKYGNHITGLYAPAGEVIKIEISEEDLKNTNGLKIEMGQYTQNNQLNNIWKARNDFNRMPLLGNEMNVTKTTTYVGTFLGGPIYVTPNNPVKFNVTISGAVEYCHFIYGLTSEEEFNRLKNSSTPFFDLEIWDKGVRHSGPKAYANLDYDNLNKISAFYLSVCNISSLLPSSSSTEIGITFIYDPFVAAGGAVAFVGRNWCNLPVSWMESSLNYEAFTTTGNWGTIHEYHHHFQRYGFYRTDEVTNNALTLLSYINYTNISNNRPLSGWNRFLDPYTSLSETLSLSKQYKEDTSEEVKSVTSLSSYADLIHTFGVDTFIKAAAYKKGAVGVDNWYESLCSVTSYNMKYYFDLLNVTVSKELLEKYNDLPMYIPIAFKYQTGRIINDNKINTVLPYPINKDEVVNINLDEDLLIPDSFTYRIKNVSKVNEGTLTINGNNLTYTPNNINESGDITLQIELINEELNYDEIQTIIFAFKPTYKGINATRYSYSSNLYNSIPEALENNFEGYESKEDEYINKHFVNGITNNQIYAYNGKIYMDNEGDYTISVRTSSRSNTYLMLGLNTNNYTDIIDSKKEAPIDLYKVNKTYNVKNGDYIYFKVIIQSFHNDGFAELFGGFNNNLDKINTKYLYNDLKDKEPLKENVDYYKRKYSPSPITYTNQSVVSYTKSFSSWDDTLKIENIVDNDINTSYHSIKDKLITSEPFEVTIDLNDTYLVNTLNIVGYNGPQMHMMNDFKLLGGETLDDLKEIGSYKDVLANGRYLMVNFKLTKLRYYKLIIYSTTSSRYVALSEINMALNMEGELVSPTSFDYFVKNNTQYFINKESLSTFGHVILGNGIIKAKTNGKSFGIISNTTNAKIKITIDGVSNIVTFDKYYYVELEEKEHEIIIEILENKVSFDSFIV